MSFIQNTSKFIKPLKNVFVIILIVFAIWMLFFDGNSLLIHNELNKEIKDLENEKQYYKKEIIKDKIILTQILRETLWDTIKNGIIIEERKNIKGLSLLVPIVAKVADDFHTIMFKKMKDAIEK